jgi:hypothetical protein
LKFRRIPFAASQAEDISASLVCIKSPAIRKGDISKERPDHPALERPLRASSPWARAFQVHVSPWFVDLGIEYASSVEVEPLAQILLDTLTSASLLFAASLKV